MGLEDCSDRDLIRQAQQGDAQSLEVLYQRYWRRMLNYLYRFTGNRTMAEDLAQETFLRVVKYLPKYRPIGSVGGWIYRIGRNVALHAIRDRARATIVSLDEPLEAGEGTVDRGEAIPGPGPKPDEEAARSETEALVQGALLKVSPTYREVLILCDIEGHSYQSAADLLGCPINTVASRLARGRAQLAEVLGYLRKERF